MEVSSRGPHPAKRPPSTAARFCSTSQHLPTLSMNDCWNVEQFDLHERVYKGKSSRLYSATDRRSGTPIALKLYRKDKLSALNMRQVEREISIQINLSNENIIGLFGSFEDENNIYLVQELAAGGDLYQKANDGTRFNEQRTASTVIKPFMNALKYLHSQGIIHRDIKPENILLDASGGIKLADFGLAIDLNEERAVTRAGTLDYMSPEVLRCPDKSFPDENKDLHEVAYSAKVDVWAVGVLAYELLVGYPPFERESRRDTFEHILKGDPGFPLWMSDSAVSFIKAALVKDSANRTTVAKLLKHPWIRQFEPAECAPKRAPAARELVRAISCPSAAVPLVSEPDPSLNDPTAEDEDSCCPLNSQYNSISDDLMAIEPAGTLRSPFSNSAEQLLTPKPPPSSEGKRSGRPPSLFLPSKSASVLGQPSPTSPAGLRKLRGAVAFSVPPPSRDITAPSSPACQPPRAPSPSPRTPSTMDRSRSSQSLRPPSGVLSNDTHLGSSSGELVPKVATAAGSLSGGSFKLGGSQPLQPSSARGALSIGLSRMVLDPGLVPGSPKGPFDASGRAQLDSGPRAAASDKYSKLQAKLFGCESAPASPSAQLSGGPSNTPDVSGSLLRGGMLLAPCPSARSSRSRSMLLLPPAAEAELQLTSRTSSLTVAAQKPLSMLR